jgi:putative nucleotidyltransferase with HDIG domain
LNNQKAASLGRVAFCGIIHHIMNLQREESLNLMREWVKSESLQKHMLCVEAAMRAYARKFGEDEEVWGIAGLLHDFDYEKFPEVDAIKKTGHPFEGIKVLRGKGCPESIIQAILGHARYSGVKRESPMAKTLFAVDELCGFLVACALMRPDKFFTLEAVSVIKKLKDKKFAAKVSREDINLSLSELGVEKTEHIDFVIQALRQINNLFIQHLPKILSAA